MTRRCAVLGLEVPHPCPRGECRDCRDELAERSALIEYGGMGLSRAQADVEARRQAVEAMPGVQRALT